MAELRRRVVMTGAAGSIGRAVSEALSQQWDLVCTDRRGDVPVVLDVTDLSACMAVFQGADAVVHLAANPNPGATWEELLPANVIGTHQVAEATRRCGIRRLVLASSLQAVSGYPEGFQLRAADPPRPANLYGATKAWAEAVGSWVAATTATSVVALRIGHFMLDAPTEAGSTARDRAAWLSPGDAAELLRCAVEADGFAFVVVNGISANRYRAADVADSWRTIGYRPKDDAWS